MSLDPGRDFTEAVEGARVTLMTNKRRDAVYLDVPLDLPHTEIVLNNQVSDFSFFFCWNIPQPTPTRRRFTPAGL